MACGARSGLKRSINFSNFFTLQRLNGLWSPFGIVRHVTHHSIPGGARRNQDAPGCEPLAPPAASRARWGGDVLVNLIPLPITWITPAVALTPLSTSTAIPPGQFM